MKSYRCVFTYAGGNTTIDIAADDGEQAVEAAASAINAGDYDRVEVWDGDDLLLTRTTPRAWDALGDVPPPEPGTDVVTDLAALDQPRTAPLPPSLPRRSPSLLTSGLRALSLTSAKTRLNRTVTRKS